MINYRRDDQSLDACRAFVADLKERLASIPFFTSDELGHYMVALWELYRVDPNLAWDDLPFEQRSAFVHHDLDYAVFHKVRKNGRVIRVEQYVIFGDEERIQGKIKDSLSSQINTAFIERFNGTLRQLDGHFHRRSQFFAKSAGGLDRRLAIVIAYYNFVRPHGTLSRASDGSYMPVTPAQAKGLTQAPWSINELLSIPRVSTVV